MGPPALAIVAGRIGHSDSSARGRVRVPDEDPGRSVHKSSLKLGVVPGSGHAPAQFSAVLVNEALADKQVRLPVALRRHSACWLVFSATSTLRPEGSRHVRPPLKLRPTGVFPRSSSRTKVAACSRTRG